MAALVLEVRGAIFFSRRDGFFEIFGRQTGVELGMAFEFNSVGETA